MSFPVIYGSLGQPRDGRACQMSRQTDSVDVEKV